MGEPICFGSRQICRVRVALLDDAGSPDNGSTNGYVTDGMIALELSPEISEGDEFELKNGCGDICQTFRDCDVIKRIGLEMTLCSLDAQLIGLMTGAREFIESPTSDVMGLQIPSVADACSPPVSLEWWAYAQDGASQATPAMLSNVPGYWHFVIPKTRWWFNDMTFENGILEVPLRGFGEENPSITANGPFDDWPSEVTAAGGVTSAFGFWLDASLPTATCDYINVTSAAS